MQAVCLHIPQVVEAVDAARDEAERGEDDERGPQQFPLQQVVAEEDWCSGLINRTYSIIACKGTNK